MTRRPRVLHCITHFALGGAERVAFSLMEALRNEIEFSVFAVRGKINDGVGQAMIERFHEMGIPTDNGLRIPMRYGGMLTGAWSMARAIRRFKPDIVHLHAEIPESSYAVLAALSKKHRQRTTIRTVHNSRVWWFHERMGRWCDRQLSRAICIAVSTVAQKEMLRLRKDSQAGAFEQPPQVILNGVTAAPITKKNYAISDPIEIIFGGRLDQQKGMDLIPEVLRLTKLPPGKRARLRIFGGGEFRTELIALSQSPPTGWEIECQLPTPDFRTRMATADLLLMPSRFEGLPLTAVEASLAGVPIIATQAPGTIEALPGNHPWLAAPGDAADFAAVLSRALSHPELWSEVAADCLKFARERFSIDEMAQAYARVYTQLTLRSVQS
ncbi:glycosyltransferase family 4 protein [Opitutaceae bacterium]|nr:glycosyltransferase family 4 protein [Opitutaceae bacterium]